MNQRFRVLRGVLDKAEQAVKLAEKDLSDAEKACPHDWKEESDPIYQEAYTIKADPRDGGRYGDVYVPSKTTPRWKRTCNNCGKVEHTLASKEIITKTARW